jgi:hypothetical protein
MPNLSRHVLFRLFSGLPTARGGRRRGLVRAAAMAAAPAALILAAGAGSAAAGPAGGAAGTSPFPGHGGTTASARAAGVTRSGAGSARRGPHGDSLWAQGPSINWALSGQASADTSQSGDPASNAIDGDAGTDW